MLLKRLGIQLGRHTAFAGALLFLCAAPGFAQSPNPSPVTAPTPRMEVPATPETQDTKLKDLFGDLTLTEEERTKIKDIHRETARRIELVQKDTKLNADQKDAMITGIGRLERSQIFQLLTPEQKEAVLKRYRAEHGAGRPAPKTIPRPMPKPNR